jgi:hypothetical protein
MLYLFGFEKVGVVFGDLYFFSPEAQGEEPGAEHGVRLEVRLLEKGPAEGSEYGSRRITADAPLWRADILETIAGPVGSHDRTHHHPEMHNWNGGYLIYEPLLKDDPVAFVAKALSDLDWLLADSDYGPEDVGPDDARQLREATPEISETLGRLIKRVQAGELGTKPPSYDESQLVRTGWM